MSTHEDRPIDPTTGQPTLSETQEGNDQYTKVDRPHEDGEVRTHPDDVVGDSGIGDSGLGARTDPTDSSVYGSKASSSDVVGDSEYETSRSSADIHGTPSTTPDDALAGGPLGAEGVGSDSMGSEYAGSPDPATTDTGAGGSTFADPGYTPPQYDEDPNAAPGTLNPDETSPAVIDPTRTDRQGTEA